MPVADDAEDVLERGVGERGCPSDALDLLGFLHDPDSLDPSVCIADPVLAPLATFDEAGMRY